MMRTMLVLALGLCGSAYAESKVTKEKTTTTVTKTKEAATPAKTDVACTAAQGETTYKVAGMTCGHCSESVSKQLSSQPEVAKATADHATGCVNVTFKPGKSLTAAQVEAQVKKAGFEMAKSGAAEEKHNH